MKLSQDGYQCEGTVAFPEKYSGDNCCCCTRHCLRSNRCSIGQCADMGIDIGQEELDAEFFPGPRVHNGLYTRCSKKYASKMWAQIACLNDEDCEYILDYNSDDRAWRYCGKMEDAVSGDEQAATFKKKWLPGPKVGNHLESKCSNSKYGSLAWAQTTCEEDPGCDWIHDWAADGNNWRFCKSKTQIDPGDEKAASMLKTLGDGLIRLRDSRYAGAALSVEEGGNKDKGKVWMWSITRDQWQVWDFRSDGTIRLRAYPEYGLSMEEGGCRNHGGIYMVRIDDSDSLSMNVVWKVYDDGTIRPRAFDKCTIAIQANQHRDRGRVWMWTINNDVWQTWGGMAKPLPKGPKIKAGKNTEGTGDEDDDEEDAKDEDQLQEQDPKKARLYLTWKATGCPALPSSSWGGWAWYLKQKDSTVLYDMYQWCALKDKKHRAACCAGKSCKPTCKKQKKWVTGSSLIGVNSTDPDDEHDKHDAKSDAQSSLSDTKVPVAETDLEYTAAITTDMPVSEDDTESSPPVNDGQDEETDVKSPEAAVVV